MNHCKTCKNIIPITRACRKIPYEKLKYCSIKCIKRAYYIKNLKQKQDSFFTNFPDWAKTETGRGYMWEQFVANLIGGQWQGFGKPFDILWGSQRIDVKSCLLYKRKNCRGKPVNQDKQSGWFTFHKFDRHMKKKAGVDLLFCIGYIVKDIPYKMWLIPFDDVPQHFSITVNQSRKYDNYLFKK